MYCGPGEGVTLCDLPAGDVGTSQTLEVMRELAWKASGTPAIRDVAAHVVGGSNPLAPEIGAELIREWLARAVPFARDPAGRELLVEPGRMLTAIRETGQAPGDCDDAAMLGAALGLSVGYRARFVVVAFERTGPMRHVWAEIGSPEPGPKGVEWWELDTLREIQLGGASVPPISRAIILEV